MVYARWPFLVGWLSSGNSSWAVLKFTFSKTFQLQNKVKQVFKENRTYFILARLGAGRLLREERLQTEVWASGYQLTLSRLSPPHIWWYPILYFTFYIIYIHLFILFTFIHIFSATLTKSRTHCTPRTVMDSLTRKERW